MQIDDAVLAGVALGAGAVDGTLAIAAIWYVLIYSLKCVLIYSVVLFNYN